MQQVQIGSRLIGEGLPVFVIAEIGVNHNGELSIAKSLIDVAVQAGADAVKFQTFHAETLVTPDAPKAKYQLETTGQQESQLEMLRKLELSHDAHWELLSYCKERGIEFLSTPFDEQATDFLNELGVAAFKVSSGDLTNSPLLRHIALKGKSVILSTGMSNIDEVIEAVSDIRSAGCENIVLLHCVSNYPAAASDTNLRAMQTMTKAFDVPVGFSDHSQGIELALAAVALGACVVEKHFTLDRDMPGPDHRASLEPSELASLIQGIRKVESALGSGKKVPTAAELDTAKVARRSLIASRDLEAGAILRRDMVVIRRPGTGLPPTMLENVLGRRLRINVVTGSLFSLDMFGEE